MLLDLERSQVIDLLPVRSADSFGEWLASHPEVEVITRDRSSLYAEGGRQGAPDAIQITDRFHLVSNLSEAVERDVQQLQVDARKQVAQSEEGEPRTTGKPMLIEARRQRCRPFPHGQRPHEQLATKTPVSIRRARALGVYDFSCQAQSLRERNGERLGAFPGSTVTMEGPNSRMDCSA
jgi:transposase